METGQTTTPIAGPGRAEQSPWRLRAGKRLFPIVLVLPTVILLLGITIFPLIYSLRLSFYSLELTVTPDPTFAGLRNYQRLLLEDSRFWNAMRNTVVLIGVGLTVQLVLGTALAMVVDRLRRSRTVILSLMLLPVVMAPIVVGFQGKMIYNAQYGPINYILSLLGLPGPSWLGDTRYALATIIMTDIWQWTPFMLVIVAAGLQTVPDELVEAARIDGASGWAVFWNVIVPMLMPLFVIAILLRFMDMFKTFDLVYMLTRGGPGDATETISFYTFKQGLEFWSFGYAAALSFIQLILISIVATIFLRFLRREV